MVCLKVFVGKRWTPGPGLLDDVGPLLPSSSKKRENGWFVSKFLSERGGPLDPACWTTSVLFSPRPVKRGRTDGLSQSFCRKEVDPWTRPAGRRRSSSPLVQ